MSESKIKPPLGVIPRKMHDLERYCDLRQAIYRYLCADLQINPAWVEEYNELVRRRLEDKQ